MLVVEIPAVPLMFGLISSGDYAATLAGMVIATIPHVMYYALLAGILAQAFPAHVRYTGISVAYAMAGMVFGGTAPMIAQALLTATGSIVPVVVFAVLTVLLSLFGVRAVLARTAAGSSGDGQEGRVRDAPDTTAGGGAGTDAPTGASVPHPGDHRQPSGAATDTQ